MKLRKLLVPLLLSLLFLLPAAPAVQAYSGYYYVIPNSAPLRECSSPGCAVLHTVYRGDKVEILERTPTGWSKVRLVDRPAGTGWIPNDQLSYSPDLEVQAMPTMFINAEEVVLRQHPRPEAKPLATLHFNDEVEMLGVGESGWAQIRVRATNLVGFVPPRYLSKSPAGSPRRR